MFFVLASPVPVPRNPSRHSLGESPNVKTVTASPLSGNISSPSPSSVSIRLLVITILKIVIDLNTKVYYTITW